MNTKKNTGVLCHISSLPGKYGIGSLRDAARFALLLADSGVAYWQILPLVETGYGDSPYQSVSCSSGNPYFIDLDWLGKRGLLKPKELKELRSRYKNAQRVDYGALYEERYATLRLAFSRFHFDDEDFRAFVREGKYEDYSLFMTAKTRRTPSKNSAPTITRNTSSGSSCNTSSGISGKNSKRSASNWG